jgi:hypothetical protein
MDTGSAEHEVLDEVVMKRVLPFLFWIAVAGCVARTGCPPRDTSAWPWQPLLNRLCDEREICL